MSPDLFIIEVTGPESATADFSVGAYPSRELAELDAEKIRLRYKSLGDEFEVKTYSLDRDLDAVFEHFDNYLAWEEVIE